MSDAIITNIVDDHDNVDEWQSALKIVMTRYKILDPTTKEKIYRYLATKGFSSTSITKVLDYIYQSDL